MSFIDKAVLDQMRDFPYKRGSFEIENYLFGEHDVRAGCWILGETVYGDVSLANQPWKTYTVPVLAYLAHLDTVRLPSNVQERHDIEMTTGFSQTFTASLEVEVSVSAGFGSANVSSGIKASVGSSAGISKSTTQKRGITMVGPGVFNIYQMHIVYGHRAKGAGHLSGSFEYHRTLSSGGHDDLFYLSSVATDKVVPVASEHSVAPLSWDEIQKATLMDGFDPELNGGRWGINYSASTNPSRCY